VRDVCAVRIVGGLARRKVLFLLVAAISLIVTDHVLAVSDKVDPPDKAALAAARRSIDEPYGRPSADKKALREAITQLVADAQKSPDVTTRYALLDAACEYAVRLDSSSSAIAVIDRLAAEYNIGRSEMIMDVLSDVAKKTDSAAEQRRVMMHALELAKHDLRGDDFVSARRAARLALQLSKRIKASEVDQITTLTRRIGFEQRAHADYVRQSKKIEDDPTDERAQLAVGEYLCMVKGRWGEGLKHLARGGGAPTAELARRERRQMTDLERIELGHAWWKRGEDANAFMAVQIKRHAVAHYQAALPGVKDVVKRRLIEKRIEEVGPVKVVAEGPTMGLKPGETGLAFDGRNELATAIFYDGSKPITVKAVFVPDVTKEHRSVVANMQGSGLGLESDSSGRWRFVFHDRDRYRVVGERELTRAGQRVVLAGVYDGRTIKLYKDGKLQGTTTVKGHKAARFRFFVGADPYRTGQPHKHFRGVIESVHVAFDALYSQDYEPKPFEAVKSTVLLLKLDEGKGDAANDSSKYKKHCSISGLKWVTGEK